MQFRYRRSHEFNPV
jgi:hypothetical protein